MEENYKTLRPKKKTLNVIVAISVLQIISNVAALNSHFIVLMDSVG